MYVIRYLTKDIKFSSDYSNESDEEEIKVKHHDGSSFLQEANLYVLKVFLTQKILAIIFQTGVMYIKIFPILYNTINYITH